MFQTKVVGKIKTHFLLRNIFPKNLDVYEIMWKKYCRRGAGHRWQYGACALHAGYLRLQTQTQNM